MRFPNGERAWRSREPETMAYSQGAGVGDLLTSALRGMALNLRQVRGTC